jgi:hypothetical protein
MADDLDVATRCARTVALLHPTSIHRAPIGMYYLYEDRHIRLQVSDQAGLDDFGVWASARGGDWTTMLLWSPYVAESERPQVFLPGDWIPYLRALAVCRSRELLDWRAAHWIPGASREAAREMAGSLAESPAVPRQGRRVPARVGDYMRTIDPIDLALTITNGH